MTETPQQYTQRILGYVEGQPPLAVQAATADKIDRLINGVSTARLRERPASEKWSVSEIVAHLADGEIVGGFRMRLILGSPGTAIVAYDQDQWVISGHYDKRDPRKTLEQFRLLREGNLDLLESLEPEQWKHYGMHSERGRESIEDIVRMFAGHDINHLRQIEEPRGQVTPVESMVSFVSGLFRDVRYSLRALRKAPAFTVGAVVTVALTVGATTAIFSVVYGVPARGLTCYARSIMLRS